MAKAKGGQNTVQQVEDQRILSLTVEKLPEEPAE